MSSEIEKSDPDDLIDKGLIKHWKGLKCKPKVIVFDLDYTLWPYYIGNHVSPPVRKNDYMEFIDDEGNRYRPFKDVTKILKTLKEHCLGPDGHIAIASRSTAKEVAMKVMEIFEWTQYISSFQIYHVSKERHMLEIKEDLKLESFDQVLFFDDDERNVKPANDLGVLPFLVNQVDGLDMDAICDGLSHFNRRRKRQ